MYRAKTAGSGANIPQNHEGRSLLTVTLHPVRTLRIVANRFELELIQQALGQMICIAARNWPSQPFW